MVEKKEFLVEPHIYSSRGSLTVDRLPTAGAPAQILVALWRSGRETSWVAVKRHGDIQPWSLFHRFRPLGFVLLYEPQSSSYLARVSLGTSR